MIDQGRQASVASDMRDAHLKSIRHLALFDLMSNQFLQINQNLTSLQNHASCVQSKMPPTPDAKAEFEQIDLQIEKIASQIRKIRMGKRRIVFPDSPTRVELVVEQQLEAINATSQIDFDLNGKTPWSDQVDQENHQDNSEPYEVLINAPYVELLVAGLLQFWQKEFDRDREKARLSLQRDGNYVEVSLEFPTQMPYNRNQILDRTLLHHLYENPSLETGLIDSRLISAISGGSFFVIGSDGNGQFQETNSILTIKVTLAVDGFQF